MDLWSLKVLDAVVEAGSVSGAAILVGRTQPQVSRIIRNLEEELGVALFLRHGRKLVATPNCHLVIAQGRRILDEVDALRATALAMRSQQEGVLHLIGPPYALYGLLPQIVARMRKSTPEVPIKLSILTRQENGEWMRPEHFDLGVAILPFRLPQTSEEALGTMEVALIVPKGNKLAAMASAEPNDLAGAPFVALRPATPLRRRIDRIMEAAGLDLEVVVTVPDTTSAIRLVMEGVGITLGDANFARQVGGEKVKIIPFSPTIHSQFGVFWPSGKPRSKHTEVLIDQIRLLLRK